MKYPYGVSNYERIITQGYYYCDRTDRIDQLEDVGDYLLFIRPRRFGKSLLLSMLKNYYDTAKKASFETLFSHLKIGKNPTALHNKYFILQWDFSCVDPTGTIADIKQALYDHVNSCIKSFLVYYRKHINTPVDINEKNAISSLQSLLSCVQTTGSPLYLLIDEYDNFANEVMTGIQNEQDVYNALVHEKGPLKTLFKAVKSAAGEGTIERIFITGVSPVVMSDITSGFNIAEDIFLDPYFNDLCGFTEAEVENILKDEAEECGFDKKEAQKALSLMRTYYNGYTFTPGSEQKIFNPTLTIYFIKAFQRFCKYPRKMLDANLATDDAKLAYIADLPGGRQLLLEITREQDLITTSDIADRFGIRDMLSDKSKDQEFLKSFLYYFGVLTMEGVDNEGKLILKVPNLVMRGLYVNRIQKMLLPEPQERDAGKFAANLLYAKGKMEPLCEFIENRYFQVFQNPDYKWANELTVKTAFLTLLYNDIHYIMDSERETGRRYADLTMIIRPDMRKYDLFDVLIEFKYVKLGDAGVTGEQSKKLTQEKLQAIPAMISQMKAAREQLVSYGDAMEKKHGDLRLRRYAVVSLGFERIWWEEVKHVF
ncbi:AAA family ATPase [Desulfobacterales bacterium HSG17]|nr:AAA family ATPase [Desulfobacterales bacterium HSG17]